MPLDPETRKRLREAAAAKKGRKNLMSLDRTGAGMAFDRVQEMYEDKTLPKVGLDAEGYCSYPQGTALEKKHDLGYSTRAFLSCWRARKQSKEAACPWVRLKHVPAEFVEQFVARFPSRRVRFRSYKGPSRGTEWETITLHPTDVVFAWMRFIWPDRLEFGEKVEKYVVGFTDRYVHDYAAKGSKLRLLLVGEAKAVDAEVVVPYGDPETSNTAFDIRAAYERPDGEAVRVGLQIGRKPHANHHTWDVVG